MKINNEELPIPPIIQNKMQSPRQKKSQKISKEDSSSSTIDKKAKNNSKLNSRDENSKNLHDSYSKMGSLEINHGSLYKPLIITEREKKFTPQYCNKTTKNFFTKSLKTFQTDKNNLHQVRAEITNKNFIGLKKKTFTSYLHKNLKKNENDCFYISKLELDDRRKISNLEYQGRNQAVLRRAYSSVEKSNECISINNQDKNVTESENLLSGDIKSVEQICGTNFPIAVEAYNYSLIPIKITTNSVDNSNVNKFRTFDRKFNKTIDPNFFLKSNRPKNTIDQSNRFYNNFKTNPSLKKLNGLKGDARINQNIYQYTSDNIDIDNYPELKFLQNELMDKFSLIPLNKEDGFTPKRILESLHKESDKDFLIESKQFQRSEGKNFEKQKDNNFINDKLNFQNTEDPKNSNSNLSSINQHGFPYKNKLNIANKLRVSHSEKAMKCKTGSPSIISENVEPTSDYNKNIIKNSPIGNHQKKLNELAVPKNFKQLSYSELWRRERLKDILREKNFKHRELYENKKNLKTLEDFKNFEYNLFKKGVNLKKNLNQGVAEILIKVFGKEQFDKISHYID